MRSTFHRELKALHMSVECFKYKIYQIRSRCSYILWCEHSSSSKTNLLPSSYREELRAWRRKQRRRIRNCWSWSRHGKPHLYPIINSTVQTVHMGGSHVIFLVSKTITDEQRCLRFEGTSEGVGCSIGYFGLRQQQSNKFVQIQNRPIFTWHQTTYEVRRYAVLVKTLVFFDQEWKFHNFKSF